MKKVLIIQTAFIGDVILATALIEKLSEDIKSFSVDMLVRKGNENLVENHPKLNQIFIWDKKQRKYGSMKEVVKSIRKEKYDFVVNLQRFFSTGLMTTFSGAKKKIGFDKNPMSIFFSHRIKHELNGVHEVDRNLKLLSFLGVIGTSRPKLYPSVLDQEVVLQYQYEDYLCMAPSSVWYTKQWPENKWIDLINEFSDIKIYLLGAPDDFSFNEGIIKNTVSKKVKNLAGKLTLLQSAALMRKAKMNYVNDSAPMHLASSVNAPVRAIFCSTIPKFGFGPLSDNAVVIETDEQLSCRPCGLHGFKSCPKGHFDCAQKISINKIVNS